MQRAERIVFAHQPGLLASAIRPGSKGDVAPLAVSQGRTIQDASASALAAGVCPGQPVTLARRLCPLLLVVLLEEVDGRTLKQLSRRFWNALASLSPTVEPAGPAAAFATLLPGEHALLQERLSTLFPGLPTPRMGIGTSKLEARILAESGASTLDSAPISSLLWPADIKVIDKLIRLGLPTFGDVAAIGEAALIYQLGRKTGTLLHRRAQGIDADPMRPLWPLPTISTRQDFFLDPLEDRACLEQWVGRLAHRAATELREMGRFARKMELILHTERSKRVKAVLPPLPLQGEREIHRAALRLLFLCQPDAPVTRLALTLSELELPAARSLSLFDEVGEVSRQRLEGVKRRLMERFGPRALTTLGAIPISQEDQRSEAVRGVWAF